MARKFLLWVDLETTGTDENRDPILEIGAVVTNTNYPFGEVAAFESVVDPGTVTWQARLGDYVREMHTKNGLLDDIAAGKGCDIQNAEATIIQLLRQLGQPHQFMLAGSGVGHFDRRFIATQMPKLDGWLSYPNADVGAVRRFVTFAGRGDLVSAGTTYEGDAFKDKPHRGMDDVRDHIAEARVYCEMFRSLPSTGEPTDA